MKQHEIVVRPDVAHDRLMVYLGMERLTRAYMTGVLELSPDEGEMLAGLLYDCTDDLQAYRDRDAGWPAERIAIVGCLPPVESDDVTVVEDDDEECGGDND